MYIHSSVINVWLWVFLRGGGVRFFSNIGHFFQKLQSISWNIYQYLGQNVLPGVMLIMHSSMHLNDVDAFKWLLII